MFIFKLFLIVTLLFSFIFVLPRRIYASTSWTIVSSPNIGTENNVLYAVATVSTNDVWAVGYYKNNNKNNILMEHWDGNSWSVVSAPAMETTYSALNNIAVVSPNDIWAVGYWGPNGNGYMETLILHWNGISWNIVESPNVALKNNYLKAVSASSSNDVWAGGYTNSSQPLVMHWNGSIWSIVPSSSQVTWGEFMGVAAIAPNNAWAVGSTNQQPLTGRWNGSAWSIVTNPRLSVGGSLAGMAVVNASDIWAVGSDYSVSLIEHWDGSSWKIIPRPAIPGQNYIGSATAVSADNVWMVGWYKISDPYLTLVARWDGNILSTVSSPNKGTGISANGQLRGISAVSSMDIWAVGNYINNSVNYTLIERYYSAPTPTSTPTPTPTPTTIPTPTPTSIPTPTPTSTPTIMPTPTLTPTPTVTPTIAQSLTPTPPEPFLDLPWDYEGKGLTFNEAALFINSYFDHEYPLLSFSWAVPEPEFAKLSTRGYDGKAPEDRDYSSHDGYDYGVPAKANYDDPVLAAASGWATYVNSCGACGNAIYIDHGNGYQTRYYHLQKDGLITAVQGEKVWVDSGAPIGKLGFSGNVSPSGQNGAHIHFMVIQDKNKDGNFEDNIPDGLTDPFGWQSPDTDPWEIYSFSYNNINHAGNRSYYLWKKELNHLNADLPANGGVFSTGKTTVTFPEDNTQGDMTLQMQAEPNANLSDAIVSLGSTISIIAKDAVGNLITLFTKPMIVTIDFTQADLTRFKIGTISIYSSVDKIHWVKEDSFTDYLHGTSTATINHLSYFAVMGELLDTIAPVTASQIEGSRGKEDWYRSNVTISLQAQDNENGLGVDYIVYRVNDEDWQAYASPLSFTNEGHFTLEYYSADKDGNIEDVKSLKFDIDKTSPSVSANTDRSPDDNYWYNHPVTITFTGEDGRSGIDICASPISYTKPDAINAVVEGSCADKAGNTASTSNSFKYDSTIPELTVSATSKGQAYTSGLWTDQEVKVTFTCTDNMSGVKAVTNAIIINSEGENQSAKGTCEDNAGNKSETSFTGINIYKPKPVVAVKGASDVKKQAKVKSDKKTKAKANTVIKESDDYLIKVINGYIKWHRNKYYRNTNNY